MTVYVDRFFTGFSRMQMCHMVADTTEELNRMADQIGLSLRWMQHPGTPKEHYDISKTKRGMAIRYGAQEITGRELGRFIMKRRQEVDNV